MKTVGLITVVWFSIKCDLCKKRIGPFTRYETGSKNWETYVVNGEIKKVFDIVYYHKECIKKYGERTPG